MIDFEVQFAFCYALEMKWFSDSAKASVYHNSWAFQLWLSSAYMIVLVFAIFRDPQFALNQLAQLSLWRTWHAMEHNIGQNRSIFSALHEIIREKELRKLKFAKCTKCGLLTPYRLIHLKGNGLQCKKCGTSLELVKSDKTWWTGSTFLTLGYFSWYLS